MRFYEAGGEPAVITDDGHTFIYYLSDKKWKLCKREQFLSRLVVHLTEQEFFVQFQHLPNIAETPRSHERQQGERPDIRADPPMPVEPRADVLGAIEQIRAVRHWTALEMYNAIRRACAGMSRD